MSSALSSTLMLSAVSVLLFGLGRFIRPLTRFCGAACLVWLAAALPVMFFMNIDARHVLLFYLISAAAGLISHFGGKPV